MKTKTINVYQYSELSEKAKSKARDWWLCGQTNDDVWEYTIEDADNIGLSIDTLSQHGANKGHFIEGAIECADKILKEHGESCETYKTAQSFLTERDAIVNNAAKDENGDFLDEWKLDKELDRCEGEFLESLLSDYEMMFQQEEEYQTSEEYIAETMEANEYEFDENGKRI